MNNKVKFLRGTSNEYAVAEKDSDTIYFTTDDGKLYIGDKEISGTGSITIDDTLSDTSTNPVQGNVIKQAIDNKADKSKYGDTTINVGRKAGSVVGGKSTAEGLDTTASGAWSHAEGYNTIAGEDASHAEGNQTTASGHYSHAEGSSVTASGVSSHAEGSSTTASGAWSHAEGQFTIANNDAEHASGKFNVSNEDTLFSVGDGTSSNNRHNAFEITKTRGKLHDKDIATTDLIPTTLPANGGNADTVDNLHADDFVNATDRNSIQIPNNTDVPAWIHTNGKRYKMYMTNGANIGMTNIPNNSTDYVWYWFDGINIIAREWAKGKYYICDVINGGFSGWKEIYTSGYKPYVTGDVPISEDGKCYTNHGFTPSVILYNLPYTTATLFDNVQKATTFDTTSFTPRSGAIGAIINYIIFK